MITHDIPVEPFQLAPVERRPPSSARALIIILTLAAPKIISVYTAKLVAPCPVGVRAKEEEEDAGRLSAQSGL
jgi:hypothetical protein